MRGGQTPKGDQTIPSSSLIPIECFGRRQIGPSARKEVEPQPSPGSRPTLPERVRMMRPSTTLKGGTPDPLNDAMVSSATRASPTQGIRL